MIQIDWYFLNGLKPPSSQWWVIISKAFFACRISQEQKSIIVWIYPFTPRPACNRGKQRLVPRELAIWRLLANPPCCGRCRNPIESGFFQWHIRYIRFSGGETYGFRKLNMWFSCHPFCVDPTFRVPGCNSSLEWVVCIVWGNHTTWNTILLTNKLYIRIPVIIANCRIKQGFFVHKISLEESPKSHVTP